MKKNGCSIPYLTRNNLNFSTKKGMIENEKEKLFLMNDDFFHELGSTVIGKAQGFYLPSSLDGTGPGTGQTLSLTVLLDREHDHQDISKQSSVSAQVQSKEETPAKTRLSREEKGKAKLALNSDKKGSASIFMKLVCIHILSETIFLL
ncbi:hypothetical protein YC2023_048917 [Brassica napus]